jgi:hypothetical protein
VEERLPSMCEALGSIPSTRKKKKAKSTIANYNYLVNFRLPPPPVSWECHRAGIVCVIYLDGSLLPSTEPGGQKSLNQCLLNE